MMRKTCKVLMITVMILAFAMIMQSCGKITSSPPAEEGDEVVTTSKPASGATTIAEMTAEETTVGIMTAEDATNLATYTEHINGDIMRGDTAAHLIQNRDELDNYIGGTAEGELRRISEKYDTEWFDSYVLVAILVGHNSCDRGEVCQVNVEENQLVLHIDITHHTWDEFSDAEKESLEAELEAGEIEFGPAHKLSAGATECFIEIDRRNFCLIEEVGGCVIKIRYMPEYRFFEGDVEFQRDIFEK